MELARLHSSPITAIQGAVLDGFREMRNGKPFGALEIGDGARHFKDAVVSTGGKSLLLHGALKQAFGVGAELAVDANLARGHLRVGEDFVAGCLKPDSLAFACSRLLRAVLYIERRELRCEYRCDREGDLRSWRHSAGSSAVCKGTHAICR
jgi:hypothetical protein